MTNPLKWTEVYPYGTKEGSEEQKFWTTIARSKEIYLDTTEIARISKLTIERVDELIEKYASTNPPMLYHEMNDSGYDHKWGYWERCPEKVKEVKKSISSKDKEDRIKKLSQDD